MRSDAHPLAALLGRAGTWRGTNRLWTAPDGPPDESASRLTVTPVLEGRFVRIDQEWAFGGQSQLGSLLVGYDRQARVASAHWIDTFHVGEKVMAFSGVVTDDGGLDVRGTYAAPPGPDWGWRIVIPHARANEFEVVMYNVTPEGREQLAVRAVYARG